MRGFLSLVMLLAIIATPVLGADPSGLYQAQAITTGTGEQNRVPGFAQCLQQAVLRVSGNQQLLAKPEMGKLLADAGALVQSFSYRDRLSGVPLHDEQGSNDRPHDLTCIYAPESFDPALASLGGKPWPTPRPKIMVKLMVVRTMAAVLTSDDSSQSDMRESLFATADAMALPITLPTTAMLASENELMSQGPTGETSITGTSNPADVDAALFGLLDWQAEGGWTVSWQLDNAKEHTSWSAERISFDEAFRIGLRGAAQILSGNGPPA